MRYLLIALLLTGCSSPTVKKLSPEAQARRDAEIRKSCDYLVGPPRDTQAYLKCKEVVDADMK